MRSLRTRITLLTVCVTIIAVVIVTTLSVMFIIRSEQREGDQMLLLMAETGEKNLDYYFNSVEGAINKVADYATDDLGKIEDDTDEALKAHEDRVREYFDEIAHKTNGVTTYYYRIDPQFTDKIKGFWYTMLDGNDFREHEPTDITQYDTNDTSQLVWFTVPKATGEPIWLPPYITDNLDVRVISYNIPVYQRGEFVGVVGIEIDYSTMAEEVSAIRLYDNGYAFITDSNGNLIYHPIIDVATLTDETMPGTPEGLNSDSTFVQYTYNGVNKEAVWLPLSNGMRLTVAVPIKELEGEWKRLIRQILIASLFVIIALGLVSMWVSAGITGPLEKLTDAAEKVDHGDYDFELDYTGNDEIGRLTGTFKQLAGHVKEHITDLNRKVYVDALTSVRNKGAFSAYLEKLQDEMDDPEIKTEFGVCVFDCDDLKLVNDRYGHDKGDIYLKSASRLICRVFMHSPVFRIGGDEFSVILQNEDYEHKDELMERFEKDRAVINATAENPWEQVNITMGHSVYEPDNDNAVIDTVRRADKDMYERKRAKKAGRTEEFTRRNTNR